MEFVSWSVGFADLSYSFIKKLDCPSCRSILSLFHLTFDGSLPTGREEQGRADPHLQLGLLGWVIVWTLQHWQVPPSWRKNFRTFWNHCNHPAPGETSFFWSTGQKRQWTIQQLKGMQMAVESRKISQHFKERYSEHRRVHTFPLWGIFSTTISGVRLENLLWNTKPC